MNENSVNKNPIVVGVKKFFDILLLNVLWLLSCVPVITVGVATSALYDVVYKDIWHNRGTVLWDYFAACKRNFRQAFPAGAGVVVAAAFFVVDIVLLRTALSSGAVWGNCWLLCAIFLAFLIIYAIWVFANVARFAAPLKTILINALVLLIKHLAVSISIGILLGLSVLLVWLIPGALFLIPSLCMLLCCHLIDRVFRGYMSKEDLQQEDERNSSGRET